MKVSDPRKLSSGNYFIQLRLDGVSVPVTAPTVKECKDAATLIKAEHRAGKLQLAKDKANPTLRQAIDDYIAARSNTLSPSTIRGYNYIQNNRFQSVMDNKLKVIKDWQSICNKEAANCSPKTLSNAWTLVVSVLRDNGILPPIVRLPQVIRPEKAWLDPTQIQSFVVAVKGTPAEIPGLLALHSLRRSEIMGLTWDKIDLDKGLIRVEGAAVFDKDQKLVQKETNKNNASRRVVRIMIPELKVALSAVEDKKGSLILCQPDTVRDRINKVCKDNGLPLIGVHGLRHSFASLGYHLGLSEMEVMEIGGWSDTQTMRDIYTHLARSDRIKAENKMSKFYESANNNANEV